MWPVAGGFSMDGLQLEVVIWSNSHLHLILN
jgi:hypothetical protein